MHLLWGVSLESLTKEYTNVTTGVFRILKAGSNTEA